MVITMDNFETEVIESNIPVLIDFWATWCGPCKMVAPIIDEIENEYSGKIKVGKIDVDSQGELALQFDVMSIPTLIVFSHGEVAEKIIGVRGKSEIEGIINKHIG